MHSNKLKTLTLAMMMAVASSTLANQPTIRPSEPNVVKSQPVFQRINGFQLLGFNVGTFKLDDFALNLLINGLKYPAFQLAINGVSASDVKFDVKENRSTGKLEIEDVTLYGMDTEAVKKMPVAYIKDFYFESQLNYHDQHPVTGSGKAKLGSFYLQNFVDQTFPRQIAVDDVAFIASSKINDDRTLVNGDISFKDIKVDQWSIGPFELKYDLNFDKKAYGGYLDFVRNVGQMNTKLSNKKLTPEQREELMSLMQAEAITAGSLLLRHGVDANVDKFNLTTQDGDITGTVKFHADPWDKKNPDMIATANVKAPVKVVMKLLTMDKKGNVMQAKQTLNSWVNQGFLVKDGDTLQLSLDLKQGKLTLNGKALSFQPTLKSAS
ncbi:MAG: hypothetical protein A3F17_06330 [Gammaproteobacteria bacterium RIFCSPHIGHO2_12_FULL_41_15]|nr:MAG: hypothetical protein A3F17_06330 [Gammaproteobacteria bacterium RIFCSPHIGHO2_12_FULL_41_15]